MKRTKESKQIAYLSWSKGLLGYPGLLYPNAQIQVYNWVHEWKDAHPHDAGPLVWNFHRAAGKSFMLCTLCIERCLRYPNQSVRYGAPSFKQCKEIVIPIIQQILNQCPQHLQPEFKGGDTYYFRNPMLWGDKKAYSTLQIIGCREGADRHRGLRSNMVVLDEVRDIDRPKYVIEDVFGPHFARKKNPLMILSSTPPASMAHYFKTMCDEAMGDNRYIVVRNVDNKDWSEEDERLMVRLLKGHNTIAYKREMLCELVADPSLLAVPEFIDVKDEIVVDQYPRPSHFYCFAGLDFGFKDYTAVVFGYLDFLEQKLIIEDEIVVHNKSTFEIAKLIKDIEKRRYAQTAHYKYMRRFSDNDAQQIYDLKRDYDVRCTPAEKHDKWASLANLKAGIQDKKIIIHRRCKNLIQQLENGVLNDNRTDFARQDFREIDPDSPIMGHCDALVALMYLWRMIRPYFMQNPFPSGGMDMANKWYSRRPKQNKNVTITNNPIQITRDRL